ncbi:hypothetical protein BKA70DRAFT_1425474 [Coprinopsis sp. MPI-PUGE-AT-0042]|nr:hypothetical protein BKA70DRAFT_1425474 [Coprinopsis sp. MPI-PUGE-AT-0042]
MTATITTATKLWSSFIVEMGGVVSQGLWGVQVMGGTLNIAARDVHNHYHRVEPTSDFSIPPVLMSVPNFRAIQIATLGRATPGTGLWIVECESFRLWLDPEGWLRIMWGHGMPGAGKTIAASIVVNVLEVHASQSALPVCVCYLYFRYSDHTKATTRSFLEVLVKQTLERHPGCLPLFNQTYARHIREQTQPNEEELLGLLHQLTDAMATFYVLDALDEAPTTIQLEIITRLTSLNVKLFITSRPMKNVEALFPNVHLFPIVAQASDINLHIDKEVSRSADLRAVLERGGPSLRDKIDASIKAKSRGMFLHVSLQLVALRECTSVHEVEETLAGFPTDIEDLYLQTWQRILDESPNKVLLAKKVLLWVLHSTGSLKARALEQAIATHPDTYSYELRRLVPVDTLVGLCRGLVVVEEETQLVRLVHYTAKHTLEGLITEAFPQPHAFLSAVCLARLTDSGFQRTTFMDPRDLQRLLQAEPFLSYAYESWFIHARQSLDDSLTIDRLADFAQNCHAFPFGTIPEDPTLREPTESEPRHRNTRVDGIAPGMCAGPLDLDGVTALIRASARGHEDVIPLLLARHDINLNAVGQGGKTALGWALTNGHQGVATLLLSHPDIDVNAVDNLGFTALMTASTHAREDMVAVLLSYPDVDVNAVDWLGETALIRALRLGRQEVVKLLLSHPHAEVNAVDENGDNPLSRAAEEGWEDIVQLLLDHPSIQVGTRELEVARSSGRCGIVHLLEEFLSRS